VLAQLRKAPMKIKDEPRLGHMPAFHGLDREQLREALAQAEPKQLTAGAVVFDEGQPARRFYLLMSGHIRFVRLTAEGDQIIVLHIPPGQMFGIGVAFGQVTHQVSAMAADECSILSWSNALWPVFSARYQGFAAETLRAFGTRADEMSTRIVELSTKLVEQRVACALLRMIGQSGRKVVGGIEIDFPITRQNVADMTNATLHTVSRLLSDWERRGLVASTRSLIVVTDPHRSVMMSTAAGARDVGEPAGPIAGRPPYSSANATDARSSARNAASSKRYSAQASTTV